MDLRRLKAIAQQARLAAQHMLEESRRRINLLRLESIVMREQYSKERRFLFYSGLIVGWFTLMIFPVIIYGFLQKEVYHPVQPIEFPHWYHVLKVGHKCPDCHPYAEKSVHAGLVTSDYCMQCHAYIATNSPRIIKLTAYHETGETVPWVRVYTLPGFVYFSHRVHIFEGLSCEDCHGPVELMMTVQQVPTLGMGWCVDCHQRRGAPMQCNTCHD